MLFGMITTENLQIFNIWFQILNVSKQTTDLIL